MEWDGWVVMASAGREWVKVGMQGAEMGIGRARLHRFRHLAKDWKLYAR